MAVPVCPERHTHSQLRMAGFFSPDSRFPIDRIIHPAEPDERWACSHEDPTVRGREAERLPRLPEQAPAGAAARAKSADPQGSIFRHFDVQSPK